MALLVVILLGVVAGASLFSSMGNARLDRRSGLNDMAKMLAQAAVEEVLVKVTNNASDFTDEKRFLYTPFATKFMALEQGFDLPQVEVLGRLVEKPSNPVLAKEFLELMTQGPGFASAEVREKVGETWEITGWDPDKDWREQLPEWAQQGKLDDLFHEMIIEMEPHGKEYHETHWKEYQERGLGGNFDDGGDIRRAFWDLKPLTKKEWYKSKADIQNVSHFNGETPDTATGEMKDFMDKWDIAMDYVADQAGRRIAGCAGNPNYGVGALIAALTVGSAVDADSEAEETFRETAQDGGLLEYQAYLLTVQGEAGTKAGTVSVKKAVTAQRLVSRMNFKAAMDKLRDNLVPYLMLHYNLTPKDLAVLGWINPLVYTASGTKDPADANDKLAPIVVLKEILTKLGERYPDNPNPRIVPFQAATCLVKTKES